jgi:hypothetical protein
MAAGTDLALAASQIDWRLSGHGRAAADRLRAAEIGMRIRESAQGMGYDRRNNGLGNSTPSAVAAACSTSRAARRSMR